MDNLIILTEVKNLKWEKIIGFMSSPFQEIFNIIDFQILEKVTELRIRRCGYITLVIRNTTYFIDCNGDLYNSPSAHCVKMNGEEFDSLFLSLCDYSLHAHMETLKEGYLTLEGGIRIGVAGEAVFEGDGLISVKNISSLNIRIPHFVEGCSSEIIKQLYLKNIPSVIIAGRPNSGKTTLLRDLARQLSDGASGRSVKVCIADERGELSGGGRGVNTDVISYYPKAKAIEIASRTLSPELIVCDEIATISDAEAVKTGLACGAAFALSVHIGEKEDLFRKPVLLSLLESGEFSYIILLDSYTYKAEIIDVSEVIGEICRNNNTPDFYSGYRNSLYLGS